MISRAKKVSDYKELNTTLPVTRYVDPEIIYINLTNNRCTTYELNVEKGDYIRVAQIIGERSGGFFKQPIYSTVSGIVGETVKKHDGTGVEAEFITVKNDFKDELCRNVVDRPDSVIDAFTQEDFVNIVKEKSIIGLGGSGFPTYIKLDTKEKINTVVVNAVECEPYLTSDYRLIKDTPEPVIKGLIYAMKALSAPEGVIAIKKTKIPLIEVLERELKRFKEYNIRLAKLEDYYPQGWEIETFKNAVGIKVPIGELPMKYGIIGFNVSTCAAIYEAVKHNMPVVKRHFTINGDAINFPQNYRVRVGTNVRDLIKLSDGYVEDVKELNFISGGPMMGVSMPTDDIVITPTTTSILVLKSTDYKEEPCVRCASCVYSCPAGIQPVQIMNAVKRNDKTALTHLEAKKCIECGLCAYVCTSKIHVTDYVRQGKQLLG